jgi:hypothetical protein
VWVWGSLRKADVTVRIEGGEPIWGVAYAWALGWVARGAMRCTSYPCSPPSAYGQNEKE